MQVSWIGPGKMGLPMCRRLQDAGHDLRVYARSDAAFDRIKSAGLIPERKMSALAAHGTLIISTISNDAALDSLFDGPDDLATLLKPGQVLVEMSTVSPECSARTAQKLEVVGVDYIRAPVSGSTAAAEAGSLTVLASGPASAIKSASPVFDAFAQKTFNVGQAEEARYLKLVINSVVGATSALLAEALTLGVKGGLDLSKMLQVINASAVASPLIAYKTDMMIKADYTAQFELDQMIKDLDLVLGAGNANQVPMTLLSGVRETYGSASAQGYGEEDFFVLFERLRTLSEG